MMNGPDVAALNVLMYNSETGVDTINALKRSGRSEAGGGEQEMPKQLSLGK